MNQLTPLAVDAYSRFMAQLFDEFSIIGNPTGFQSFFGNPATGGSTFFSPDSLVADIDIQRGTETISAMIQRGSNSRPLSLQKNTDLDRYSSISRVYPLIEEEGDISANQINQRMAGENPYQPMGKLDRLRELANRQHFSHIRRIIRTFETLCASAILTGKHPAIIGTTDVDWIYDFYRNPDNTLNVVTGWNQAGAKILGDVDEVADEVRQNGNVNPDMLLLGGLAMTAFIADEGVQALADNRRFELIEVSVNNPVPAKFTRFVEGGFTPRGRLRTPKGYELWLFTYIDGYTDLGGNYVKYMPTDEGLVAYSGARCDRYFGPSETLPLTGARAAWYQELFGFNPLMAPMPPNIKGGAAVVTPAMFYFDAYEAPTKKTATIRTQAAGIFAPTMTDAFGHLTGLIT